MNFDIEMGKAIAEGIKRQNEFNHVREMNAAVQPMVDQILIEQDKEMKALLAEHAILDSLFNPIYYNE